MNKKTIRILLQDAHQELIKTVEAVPADKLHWRPLDNGRAILDLLGEVAQTASFATEVARTRGSVQINREVFQNWKQQRTDWTREFALEQLDANISDLLAAIEELGDDELDKDTTMTMRGEVTMPLAAWIMLMYRTLISRYSQINYIQTLYGDFDFH